MLADCGIWFDLGKSVIGQILDIVFNDVFINPHATQQKAKLSLFKFCKFIGNIVTKILHFRGPFTQLKHVWQQVPPLVLGYDAVSFALLDLDIF